MEVEDDMFFAELSEQIALLIMDEEEEFPLQCQPLPVQGLHRHHVPQAMVPPPCTYYEYENEMAYANARESKGTGVFIPRFTEPRRKHRAGRSGSNNANSQKRHQPHPNPHPHPHPHHQEKKRVAVSNSSSIAGQREKPLSLS